MPGLPWPGPGAPPDSPALVDQEFDDGSLYALRSAVGAHAAAAGAGADQVYDVVAAVHELAANAVRHGPGHGRLRLWADAGFLYCQVTDGDTAGPPAGDAAPWPAEHGHGLWLIGQVADRVAISHGSGGTTATIRFAITPPGT